MSRSKKLEKNQVFLVHWKEQNGRTELFCTIEVFVQSYPRYDIPELCNVLSGIAVFEDDEVRIERRIITTAAKPNFRPCSFGTFSMTE